MKICDFLVELLIVLSLVFCVVLGIGLFLWGITTNPIITCLVLVLLIIYCIIEDKYIRNKYQKYYKNDLQK